MPKFLYLYWYLFQRQTCARYPVWELFPLPCIGIGHDKHNTVNLDTIKLIVATWLSVRFHLTVNVVVFMTPDICSHLDSFVIFNRGMGLEQSSRKDVGLCHLWLWHWHKRIDIGHWWWERAPLKGLSDIFNFRSISDRWTQYHLERNGLLLRLCQ